MKEEKVLTILTILMLLFFAVVMLSSCSREEGVTSLAPTVPLQVSGNATIVPDVITRHVPESDSNLFKPGATRGSSQTDLPAQTSVGVYALSTGTPSTTVLTTTLKNAEYTATGSNGIFTTSAPIRLEYRQSYKVCAYAPYQSQIADATAVSFSHGTDVLYAPLTDVTISQSTGSATLRFEHKVSQIQFNLKAGSGSPDLTGATLGVSGFLSGCTLNLSDGTLVPEKGAGAMLTDLGKTICIVPDSQPMTLNVTVTTKDGNSYTGTITRAFVASNSYSYTLTVNRNQTELGINSQIIDWIAVSAGNVKMQ